MIGFLIPLFVNRGLTERAAKVAAWAVIALLAVLLVVAAVAGWHRWLQGQRDDAVQLDRADITAAAANKVLEADRAATANQTAADAAFANDQLELHDAARNSTSAPVGPGVQSVLDRMRAQQAAGRR